MSLPYHVWYRLFRAKWVLAAELTASEPRLRAWVKVVPLKTGEFLIHYFELDKKYIENQWDVTGDELENQVKIRVTTEEELEVVLSRWLDDLEKLVVPSIAHSPL